MSLFEGLVFYCENLIVVKGKTWSSSRGLEYIKCPRKLTGKEREEAQLTWGELLRENIYLSFF